MKSQKFTRTAIEESIARATALERSLGTIPRQADLIPAGYRKREEWQSIWGLGQATACKIIKQHVANGRMKMIKLTTVDIGNRTQKTAFYKAIK